MQVVWCTCTSTHYDSSKMPQDMHGLSLASDFRPWKVLPSKETARSSKGWGWTASRACTSITAHAQRQHGASEQVLMSSHWARCDAVHRCQYTQPGAAWRALTPPDCACCSTISSVHEGFSAECMAPIGTATTLPGPKV